MITSHKYGRVRWIKRRIPSELKSDFEELVLQQERTASIHQPPAPPVIEWIDVPVELETQKHREPVRLKPGQRVVTASGPAGPQSWTEEGLKNRQWNVARIVTSVHDSHGLCYDVRYEDGTEGCFNHEELITV